jgi:serine/threonine-protein kinase
MNPAHIRNPQSCDISRFYVQLADYERIKTLTPGAFGRVYLARHKARGDLVVVKELYCNVEDQKSKQTFEREVGILGTVRHPALLTLHCCTPFVDNPNHSPAILTPFMANGSLDDILTLEREGKSPCNWTVTRKHITLFGIACGMMFMHEHRLIHRDLKPGNVATCFI